MSKITTITVLDFEKSKVFQYDLDKFDDLEWVEDDRNFDDFINSQNIEHIRIYDYALLELSRRLLKKLDIEI